MPGLTSNFVFFESYEASLFKLGLLAERYFADDPETTLIKLRQLSEQLTGLTATTMGRYRPEETHFETLKRLEAEGIIPSEMARIFHEVRKKGNLATHQSQGNHHQALGTMKLTWQLALWFHRTFKDNGYQSGPFIPPSPPKDEGETLKAELERLNQVLQQALEEKSVTLQQLELTHGLLKGSQDDLIFWRTLSEEIDKDNQALKDKLAEQQKLNVTLPKTTFDNLLKSGTQAAQHLQLDEKDTRKLIDAQLRDAGWFADSETVVHRKGTRPEKGKNMAIAEWPTRSGPADYVLFMGLKPVATVEAKRKNIDVSAALQQAKRYSRDFVVSDDLEHPGGLWNNYQIPFTFSSNGRPYLKQIATRSGIWFADVRKPGNLSRALDGWYTPEGLKALLKVDEDKAHQELAAAEFDYDLKLRPYQQLAIRAAETAIANGQREMLLAMATGTGKTKTCIALIYRLLKVQRFRRVLFLVDRSALGIQAANAFKDTRMENLQTFADIFGIKELEDQTPDSATSVHIATVQGMVKRLLMPSEDATIPSVDQYDCIVIDECHRGYLLDRELSDTEMTFRDYDDYISKYRRVIEYFDAVKIGLTATPALHTTQIFGEPIYTYSYREAVVDGFLIDYEPPVQIVTELAQNGMLWAKGAPIKLYNPKTSEVVNHITPDAVTLEVEDFNRKVITTAFNKAVCDYLATELDPQSKHKTLIFCVNDAHADLVVQTLKESFSQKYGSVDDDAVVKITGSADKPLELIRRYKNEVLPNIAVTVDLLTTGIDVPEICNLVFLRRGNSRILYDQMMGRATRLCEDIGKDYFRIFDAVKLFEALADMTDMKPVVTNPDIGFEQLIRELTQLETDDERGFVRDQMLAKLQRKKQHMTDTTRQDFETVTGGLNPDAFIAKLKGMTLNEVAQWFVANPQLGEILDRKGEGQKTLLIISEHEDALVSAERGYGNATRPQDYLDAFGAFIRANQDTIPALVTVLTRPRDLTRKELRQLTLELDRAGFTESNLKTAYLQMTNQEMTARLIGYIRKAAMNEPLLPFEQRVDNALQRILAQKAWSTPQRDWLKRIAAQTKANTLVDKDALDDPNLLFKREGGGFTRLDRIFDGQLEQLLASFNESLWQSQGV